MHPLRRLRRGVSGQPAAAQQLYWYAKTDDFERAQHHNLMDCTECGACCLCVPQPYSAGAVLPLRQGRDPHPDRRADQGGPRPGSGFEARQARLEREQAEKEARRRARLEANRKKQEAATDSRPGAGDEKAWRR